MRDDTPSGYLASSIIGFDCNGNDSGAIEEHEIVWHLQFVFLWPVAFINAKAD